VVTRFTPGATSSPDTLIGPFGTFANSFASFLLGAPTVSGVTTSSFVPSYLSDRFGGFVADRIHMKRLTIDLGVRYDLLQANPATQQCVQLFYLQSSG